MSVLMNLKSRGMKDAFIICVDGLKGFPEAIEAVFPSTLVQTCIVHLIRASLKFVTWKERKALAADLKLIYRAATAEMAELALAEFRVNIQSTRWWPMSGRGTGSIAIPFFEFPEEIRKIIYTTNAVESLHMTLRKVSKNRGSFPTQESAIKLFTRYRMYRRNGVLSRSSAALRQFAIRWPDRFDLQSRCRLRKNQTFNNMGIAFTIKPLTISLATITRAPMFAY